MPASLAPRLTYMQRVRRQRNTASQNPTSPAEQKTERSRLPSFDFLAVALAFDLALAFVFGVETCAQNSNANKYTVSDPTVPTNETTPAVRAWSVPFQVVLGVFSGVNLSLVFLSVTIVFRSAGMDTEPLFSGVVKSMTSACSHFPPRTA